MINSQKTTGKPSVPSKTPKMNEAILTELKNLLTILSQCLTSFRADFNTLDCNSSQTVMTSLIFKLEKLSECAKTIQKICKSLKKETIPCLPCVQPSVDEELPKEQEPQDQNESM